MYLDKVRDLKKKTGLTNKYIAEKMHRSERTVARFFSGEKEIGIDELRELVSILGGTLDEVLDESDFKLPTPEVEALKNEVTALTSAVDELKLIESALRDEIAMLKDKIIGLDAENDRLRLMLAHKEEVISLQRDVIDLHKQSRSIPEVLTLK